MTTSLLGLLLSLVSALAWAGLDASRKVLVRDVAPIPLVVWLTIGQAPIFAIWAAWDGDWWRDVAYLPPGLGCLVLNVLANVAFVRAVQVSPFSVTVPFLSLTPVFAAIVAIPLVGELPNPQQWVGIAVVVLGAYLLNAGGEGGAGLLGPLRAFVRERGSVLMTLVALMWSLTAALDKMAVGHASVGAHALVQTGGVAVVLFLWLVVRGQLAGLAHASKCPRTFGLAILFAAAAIGFQLTAVQLVFVALVETIKRAVGMTMSVVLGRLLFEERIDRFKVLAVGLMVIGTALLALV